MPVAMCGTDGCGRLISISNIPGGNPVALADPERWATVYMVCGSCGTFFCDRCLKQMGGFFKKAKCSKCGGELKKP
jgi:hypothetical protein